MAQVAAIHGMGRARRVVSQVRPRQPALLGDYGATADQGAGRTLIGKGSESADYLTARIARDRPDILERMKDGEFPSVRASAQIKVCFTPL